jgi:hypothetical protein
MPCSSPRCRSAWGLYVPVQVARQPRKRPEVGRDRASSLSDFRQPAAAGQLCGCNVRSRGRPQSHNRFGFTVSGVRRLLSVGTPYSREGADQIMDRAANIRQHSDDEKDVSDDDHRPSFSTLAPAAPCEASGRRAGRVCGKFPERGLGLRRPKQNECPAPSLV